MRLLLVGQLFGCLGIPNHTRSLFRNLIANREDIEIKVLPTHPVPQDESHAMYDLTSDIKDCIITPAQARDWSPTHVFIFWTPEIYKQIRSYFSGQNCKFIGYGIFEWTIFSKEFTEEINQMDYYSVPSKWAQEVCLENKITIPVNILHAGIEEPYLSSPGHNYENLVENPDAIKEFLFVGKMENRKSFDECVTNFADVNRSIKDKNKRVHLKLLTFNQFGSQTPAQRLKELNIDMENDVIYPYVSRVRNPTHMRKYIYETHDFILIPSKAGAIELPLLESMACGCVPICTNYSGMSEYLIPNSGWNIPIKTLEGIFDPTYFPNKGKTGVWGIPDWEAFKGRIKSAINIEPEVFKAQSELVREWVITQFNYKTICKEYLCFLEKL